jgi:NADH-quinone oxidoreductase subunit N
MIADMTTADLTTLLLRDLSLIRPELVLAGFAMAATLIGAVFGNRSAGLIGLLGFAALVAAGVLALVDQQSAPATAFFGSLRIDGFSAYAKAVIAFSAAFTLLLGQEFFAREKDSRFEFAILTVLAVLGMFVMASANDLITLYMGVELQSLAAYVMAAWRRDESRSSEAGLKYFVLGALSSGLLLYGASLVYGFAGSIRFEAIAVAATAGGATNVGLVFGLVFMICGLAFKLAAAPFHMWTPDVYEGAPTPVTALFAAAPKLAAIALLVRVLYEPFGALTPQWQQVVSVIAALSLGVGSVIALAQTSLKRLMAYSSIANMGFALLAVSAGGPQGAAAALIYMTIYLPTTIGIFALLLAMRREGGMVETIDDLAGIAQRRPWIAAAMTVLMFSIAGIPPVAGFWGKWFAFSAAFNAGLTWLVLIAAIATVIAAAYYLNIIRVMWMAPPVASFQPAGPAVIATAVIAAALCFPVLFIAIGQVEAWATMAARSSFAPLALSTGP